MEATSNGGEADELLSGKRTDVEWDARRWKWDGDLFIATPVLNPTSNNHQSKQFFPLNHDVDRRRPRAAWSSPSDDLNLGKRIRQPNTTRVMIVEDDDRLEDDPGGNLTLQLGGQGFDPTTSKKLKMSTGATSNNAVLCQVEDCGADLTKAREYHRRHKVCEMHSKARRALVANVFQRFCQQCSRFHALQEFDEGKRSCRRRLACHNKRRRKTKPDSVVDNNNNNSLSDNQTSGCLLMSLLKILSDIHSTRASGTNHEDHFSHLLRSLASPGSLNGDKNISAVLQESQKLMNWGPSLRNSNLVPTLLSNSHQIPPRPKQQNSSVLAVGMPPMVEDLRTTSSQRPGTIFPSPGSSLAYEEVGVGSAARSKLNNFDLNNVYIDSDDGVEDVEQLPVPADLRTGSPGYPSWLQPDSHQSSPLQTSGNSDSASAQSPSSSSGEAQSRTDRIVFKLFGREPSDFPFVLRAQILDWLSHSPTDIESYIRPGCIILTLYLRLPENKWEELCCNLSSSLNKLMDVSDDGTFWRTGWIHTRVQNHIAFIYNGQIVVDTALSFSQNEYSTILSIKPIAVPVSETAQFVVKGINLSRYSTSLLCALEGNYLALEANRESNEHIDGFDELGKVQCLKFSCTFPAVTGRGFLEVEDHGLSCSFFPFIVADTDICSEISIIESEIEWSEIDNAWEEPGRMAARDQALEFIHEMGWLLRRNNFKSKLRHLEPNSSLFPFRRYKWLVEFSVNHDWCAVVRNLLDILFDGRIGGENYPFLKYALFELGLLHRAVHRNSRTLVELLLRYTPQTVAEELSLEYRSLVGSDRSFLFRPDFGGPGGLTPLHVAACRDGCDDVLDALTNDPGGAAIGAWENARDSMGFTPDDYARVRGHHSYIHLVRRKIHKRAPPGHVVIDVPSTPEGSSINQKQDEGVTTTFENAGSQLIRSMKHPCRVCDQRVAYGSGSQCLLYRSAILLMVGIAAVCVCVGLLFKSSPEVLYIFTPFRWEMLDYGSS